MSLSAQIIINASRYCLHRWTCDNTSWFNSEDISSLVYNNKFRSMAIFPIRQKKLLALTGDLQMKKKRRLVNVINY